MIGSQQMWFWQPAVRPRGRPGADCSGSLGFVGKGSRARRESRVESRESRPLGDGRACERSVGVSSAQRLSVGRRAVRSTTEWVEGDRIGLRLVEERVSVYGGCWMVLRVVGAGLVCNADVSEGEGELHW